ncbi:P-loop containing nucleoside triphosphate hydrolase protein [Russula earlei]|uniref:P-loop containing nucleoside triphosphate hydrolase protein n=1 Tax=Russula earlei TaxID=71964 RepID=A0ACC0ULY7_9AGAM|nr:P-loop containing nucleoside triphosphate hydrolase protein [Russula earlei]
MPRIRKKTSKRGTTVQRANVKRKVTESRRKSKKAAKKDLTWKSKKSKDPGIPNNFPYKDQILAEIAEERRQVRLCPLFRAPLSYKKMRYAGQAAEAKARRKEEKKNLRAHQRDALKTVGKGSGEHSSANVEEGDFDGVVTLGDPSKSPSKSTKGTSAAVNPASIADTHGAPPVLTSDLSHMSAVLDKADVVIEVLDARDPLACRSSALESRVASKEGQKLLLVLNKIDTCPRETTAAWAAHLRSEHPTLLFRVASSCLPPPVTHDPTKGKRRSEAPSDDAWGSDAVSTLLELWAEEKSGGDGPLHVAVVGLTNSGKSAFINSLARKNALDVYASSSFTNSPSTTPHALEVTLELNDKPLVFIDTPGTAWQPSEDASHEERERRRAQDILLRNRGRIDRLKDPLPAVSCVVSRAETEDLMVFYGLPAFAKGDVDAFLVGVARAHGLVKKASLHSIMPSHARL